MRSVIIVGAGVAGLATAARLAPQGYQVTVLEKNATPGGRCSQINREGHRFDIGATLYLMPEVFEETYQALGGQRREHFDLARVDPSYHLHFEDGSQFAPTTDMDVMKTQLEALEPGSFEKLLSYLAEGQRNYQLSLQHFVGRNFYRPQDYFTLANLVRLFQVHALQNQYKRVSHYFNHPHLKTAFTFQDVYLGMSPYEAPATYSLLQYTEFADGVWFPIGGMYRIIESLAALAEQAGVEIACNTPVERIEVQGNQAQAVILKDGTRLTADIIVANADLPYVYQSLLPDNAQWLERKQYTCSAVMFYWGIDRVYPELKTHNLFLAEDYRGSFEAIFHDKRLPQTPSFYVHAPARVDPSAAPAQQDSLMILVPTGHLTGQQDETALQNHARAAVLTRLAEAGLTDLADHIKFEISYTPKDWASRFNLAKGSAFGLSHNVLQVGYLRPHNRHPRYHNLYFAGSSTHPGAGVPMALLSARLTTERIMKEAA